MQHTVVLSQKMSIGEKLNFVLNEDNELPRSRAARYPSVIPSPVEGSLNLSENVSHT